MKSLHMRKTKNSQGFTLIELMVVMAIVALLMSLVGPMTIEGYEKIKAKEEQLSLKNWIKGNSYRSFATGKASVITLSGVSISLSFEDDYDINSELSNPIANSESDEFTQTDEIAIIASRSFEHLTFQPQQITVNTFGLISPSEVTIQSHGKTRTIIVSEQFDATKK